MTMNKKIVGAIAFVAVLGGFSDAANAAGIPVPYSDYLGEYLRGYTTEVIGEKKLTKIENNMKFVEEISGRGNNIEAGAMYGFVENNLTRFGEDPEAYMAANEQAMKKALQDHGLMKDDEEEDEAAKKLEEEKKKQEEEKKAAEAKAAEEAAAKAAATSQGMDDNTDNTGDLKAQTYKWLQENRSVNEDGESFLK